MANIGKRSALATFCIEYRRMLQVILDDVWENGYDYMTTKGEAAHFSVSENKLHAPLYIDYKKYSNLTFLTARALSSLTDQLCGILKAAVEKQRKRVYVLTTKKGTSRKGYRLLVRKIKTNIPQKPCVDNIRPELSSKCAEWIQEDNPDAEFDGFLWLKSIVKSGDEIILPVKFTKHSNKLKSLGGRMMGSFLIGQHNIDLRWSIPVPELRTEGVTVGADQGLKDVITLSDEQRAGKMDIHGHTLDSILDRMCRLKRGSNAMKRAQDQRENFVNWSLNQLNLTNVKEIRLEHIWNISYKHRTSVKLSHWTNTLIRDKVESLCELNGVRLTLSASTYMSQRCNACGRVRKANRKGKVYMCDHCGNEVDADLNAACNHALNLPEVPYTLWKLQLNRKGFFWNLNGFSDAEGRSLEFLPPVEQSA